MSGYDVIALGVAVVDIVASTVDKRIFDRDNTPIEQITISPGGDAVNQAIGLAKLGNHAALCCRVGKDAMGHLLLGEIEKHGVDTSQIAVAADSVTSTAIVFVGDNGQRNIICKKGNNYDFNIGDVDIDAATSGRALSVGSLFGIPALEDNGLTDILRCAKRKGVVTFADMGSDKKGLKLKGVRPFLPLVDYFMPSEVESAHLTNGLDAVSAAEMFHDVGAKNVIIKLGGRGVYADCAGFTGFVDPFAVSPIDTTGAGDAFCAGFIHSVLHEKEITECLTFASACGAMSTLGTGANAALLDADAIRRFMEETPRRKQG